MNPDEIEIVARVLMRRMYNEETSRAQEGDDTGLWKVVKEDAQAAITALDQYREGKERDAEGYNESLARAMREDLVKPKPLPPITLGPLFK